MNEVNEVIKKIIMKAKSLKFFAQKKFSESGTSVFVCAQEVCTHPDYPKFYFVIDSNMIYKGNKMSDSSYTVYSFDEDGNYIEEVDISSDLPLDFMAKRKTYIQID
jgi:hypothetical protein